MKQCLSQHVAHLRTQLSAIYVIEIRIFETAHITPTNRAVKNDQNSNDRHF